MPQAPRHEKRWVFAPADRAGADKLAVEARVPPLVAQLLINRGVGSPAAARDFLRPDLNGLHDPLLLPGVAGAADRIARAVADGEKIVVYGDYDVDGITATAILLECVALAGGKAEYYLPNRQEEGYGLNADAVRALAGQGTRLVVTVDCGVTAVAEAALARELGMDLIVTDHHEPGPETPDALHIINPRLNAGHDRTRRSASLQHGRPGRGASPQDGRTRRSASLQGGYPFPDLAGAGVAFKLAWALALRMSDSDRASPEFRRFLLHAVCLAGLGSIADVVPLRGENRILASFALRGLGASDRPGIRALRETASVKEGPLSAWDVAFRLAPRLNAAGRLGCARRAVELLMAQDDGAALALAKELDTENTARRAIQDGILSEAMEMVEAMGGAEGRMGLVLASDSWNTGVVGIVAGQLSERLCRPTVVIAENGEGAHGSARSAGGVNLFQAISQCADLLESFGGHARAAGVRIAPGKIEAFRERFEQAVAEQVGAEGLAPVLEVDAEARLAELDYALVREIKTLEPFGEGNRPPVFASLGLRLTSPPRRVGSDGKHLSFWATQDGAAVRAIAFNMGDMAGSLHEAEVCTLAYQPRLNEYRGKREVEVEVQDIKLDAVV